jgi:hypothetical protein
MVTTVMFASACEAPGYQAGRDRRLLEAAGHPERVAASTQTDPWAMALINRME